MKAVPGMEVCNIRVSRRFSKCIDMLPLKVFCDRRSREDRAIRSVLALLISQS